MMMNCSTAFPISVTSWSSTDDSYIISDPHKRLTLLDTFCRTRQRKPCDPCLVPSPYFMKAICRTKALFGHVGTDCGLWVSMAAALALAINPPPSPPKKHACLLFMESRPLLEGVLDVFPATGFTAWQRLVPGFRGNAAESFFRTELVFCLNGEGEGGSIKVYYCVHATFYRVWQHVIGCRQLWWSRLIILQREGGEPRPRSDWSRMHSDRADSFHKAPLTLTISALYQLI